MAVFKYFKDENDIDKLSTGANKIVTGGDKSVTHRALMFAALAPGVSNIINPSRSLDCAASASALKLMGVKFSYNAAANKAVIESGGRESFTEPCGFMDCANSATTARLLMGLTAAAEGRSFFLSGDRSLLNRPMSRAARPLEAMGAKIVLRSGKCLPAAVSGRKLSGITFDNIYNSAQVKAALIFAAFGAGSETSITEKYITRDHSEIMAEKFGLEIKRINPRNGGVRLIVPGAQKALPADIKIPNDPSTAAFYITLDALVQLVYNRRLKIKTPAVLNNETRNGFFDCLFDSGFDMIYTRCDCDNYIEKAFDIEVNYGAMAPLAPQLIDSPEKIVSMIDEIPLAALVLSLAKGESFIGGLSELRLKETDRLAAIACELNKMGAEIKLKKDALTIRGVKKLRGAKLESYADHRMAMTLIIAGIISGGDFSVNGCDCVSVSNPGFYDVLRKIGFKFHIE